MPVTEPTSPGARFRVALAAERPLQVIGAINANHALLARRAGFRALYLSGGGVAAGSLGLPDLGISGLEDVLIDVRRITDVCDLPLLVDIDTGFGPSAFNIERTVKALIKAGAAACHIEDQVGAKRCGHRPGKEIVSAGEMTDRVKAAADARTDPAFFLIARTDAIAVEAWTRRSSAPSPASRPARTGSSPRPPTIWRRFAVSWTRSRCRCSPTSPSSARPRCSRARSSPARASRSALSAVRVPRHEQGR
jgi:hypothetical protein